MRFLKPKLTRWALALGIVAIAVLPVAAQAANVLTISQSAAAVAIGPGGALGTCVGAAYYDPTDVNVHIGPLPPFVVPVPTVATPGIATVQTDCSGLLFAITETITAAQDSGPGVTPPVTCGPVITPALPCSVGVPAGWGLVDVTATLTWDTRGTATWLYGQTVPGPAICFPWGTNQTKCTVTTTGFS